MEDSGSNSRLFWWVACEGWGLLRRQAWGEIGFLGGREGVGFGNWRRWSNGARVGDGDGAGGSACGLRLDRGGGAVRGPHLRLHRRRPPPRGEPMDERVHHRANHRESQREFPVLSCVVYYVEIFVFDCLWCVCAGAGYWRSDFDGVELEALAHTGVQRGSLLHLPAPADHIQCGVSCFM